MEGKTAVPIRLCKCPLANVLEKPRKSHESSRNGQGKSRISPHLPQGPLRREKMLPGWDIIVVGRGRSVKGPYEKMNEAYLDCLRRLSLLREETL